MRNSKERSSIGETVEAALAEKLAPACSITEFVARVRNQDYQTIIDLADMEAVSSETFTYGDSARARGAAESPEEILRRQTEDYVRLLNGLLSWLYHGFKPHEVSDREFLQFRPICESLIQRGQMNREARSAFAPALKAE